MQMMECLEGDKINLLKNLQNKALKISVDLLIEHHIYTLKKPYCRNQGTTLTGASSPGPRITTDIFK